MKKVININFQGRVIPIEESAYDMLKKYVESLRRFFADEEGRDEIINDIEGRIAELFGESLKKGSTCITEDDVRAIMVSMGRPEDFEGEEGKVHSQLGGEQQQRSDSFQQPAAEQVPRERFYRNDSDKFLGGVCSGIANYFRIDPSIVRLVFVLICFAWGMGILIYVILWAFVPSKLLAHNNISTKRLYRNPEEKVIAGVASGIAAYFDIAVWIPRLIFSLPIIFSVWASFSRSVFWDHDPFPGVMFGSFGGTIFIVYAILWGVLPEARSASDKLEMRGEKVDLNTIKNTIQEDLEGFKHRAEKWGGEFGEKAMKFGQEFGDTVGKKGMEFGSEAGYVVKKGGNKVLNAIGILFKAFFLFVAGIMVFALLIALIAIAGAGVGSFPLKNFFLEGFWQNTLAWLTLLLFLCVPVIAFITWLIRRIMGVRSGRKYLGFTFGGLWFVGLVCGGFLAASIFHNFDARAREKQDYNIVQPTVNKLVVKVPVSQVKVYGGWFKMDGIISMSDDSLFLNNVRLDISKSPDSLYHIFSYKFSNGSNEGLALRNTQEINYNINQEDSTVWLDRGFSLRRGIKFRNQGVQVTIQVPVGKKIVIDRSVSRRLSWFRINDDHNNWDTEDEWNDDFEEWDSNVEYIMTGGGLEKVYKEKREQADDQRQNDRGAMEQFKKSKEKLQKEYEKKQKEAEELKKELEKPMDTLQLKKSVSTTTTAVKPIKQREVQEPINISFDNSRLLMLQLMVL